ncbi:hypothetical protein BJ165DRAFT_1410056 [Panaeolus papilionaceus]|nr:hypothetical protein BJ165DRAFT_1410056 [Panaeolus papilionaceus]
MSVTGKRILINHLTYHVSNIVTDTSHAIQLLHDHICVAAYDNSDEVDETKCYPGTRTLILARLEHWLDTPGNARRLFTWLTGPMGAGKSALARSMAERASHKEKLLVRPFIAEQLSQNPAVLQQSLHYQLHILILVPLRRMRFHYPDIDPGTFPNLIIVDGLDECGADEEEGKEERQLKVLDLLHRLARSQDVIPFAILVHSRPERQIKSWFSMEGHEKITNRFTLDASYKPNDDIRFFVTQSFLRLLEEHPSRHLLPPKWPASVWIPGCNLPLDFNIVEFIVSRSSGQFIYAATFMRFIASKHHRPDKRLEQLLHRQQVPTPDDAPEAIMDALYTQVLNSTDDHKMVRDILAFNRVQLDVSWMPIDQILSILSISRQDLFHCLDQLESIAALKRNLTLLEMHHSSLHDFLSDASRSKSWYINPAASVSRFLLRSLTLFRTELNNKAQTSYLRAIHELFTDHLALLPNRRNVELQQWCSAEVYKELGDFCNFLFSSYRASVMRFLEKVSIFTFFEHLALAMATKTFIARILDSLAYISAGGIDHRPQEGSKPQIIAPSLWHRYSSWIIASDSTVFGAERENRFRYLLNEPTGSRNFTEYSVFNFALGQWGTSPRVVVPNNCFFLKDVRYSQILIPGVPELAHYRAIPASLARDDFLSVCPMYSDASTSAQLVFSAIY